VIFFDVERSAGAPGDRHLARAQLLRQRKHALLLAAP
jgi:hypothetical protein